MQNSDIVMPRLFISISTVV